MPTPKYTRTDSAAFHDYLAARTEVVLARREQRLPNVRLGDVVELCGRVERVFGEMDTARWDILITARIAAANGQATLLAEGTEDPLADLRRSQTDEMVDAVTAYLDKYIEMHQKRTQQPAGDLRHVTLPATVEAVQTRGAPLSYQGTWKPDGDYRQGHMVTRDGVLWHCNQDTYSKPGTSPAWQMMHKNLTRVAP